MEEIDINDAKTRFEQLIEEAEKGKIFVITQQGVAIAKLQSTSKHFSSKLKKDVTTG